jgi:ABC-2 type transport system permease protein
MTHVLFLKLLRDLRLPLLLVGLLLFLFESLWGKVTEETIKLIADFRVLGVSAHELLEIFFRGPAGEFIRTLIGGAGIRVDRALDLMSVGFVHPTLQTILCIWAVGRSSGAIAGEIDRGTMELLLAQPMARWRVVLAHFLVDCVTIPALCLSMWLGVLYSTWRLGRVEEAVVATQQIDPWAFLPALLAVAALLFAVSGYSIWLSSCGRFRWRVMGAAVIVTLVQFLVNVIAQLWSPLRAVSPFTVFQYYQPQQIILDPHWFAAITNWRNLGVLSGVGATGYLLALWTFCRRDLPAPL